jgi:hypothetical protein
MQPLLRAQATLNTHRRGVLTGALQFPRTGPFRGIPIAETHPHAPPFLAIKLCDPLQAGFSMMDAIGMLSALD